MEGGIIQEEFVQRWLEIETETYVAPKVQMKNRRKGKMSKEFRTARG